MLGIFLAAFSYVAALMGAGFASGQETLTFFAVFSRYGAVGIVIASVMIGVFGGVVSEYAMRADIDYNELTARLFSCRASRLYSLLVFTFSICTTAVMCACFGELGTMLGLSRVTGAALLAAVSSAVLLTGKGGTVRVNAVLGAVIFICAAAVCLFLLGYREHQAFRAAQAAASGVSYAGYNLISVGSVLASGRVFLKRRHDGYFVGFAAAAMVCVLLLLMWAIISIYYGKIDLGELPMITLTLRESSVLAACYGFVMAAAVFTTAISSGMCASEYAAPFVGNRLAVLLCMAAGFMLSGAGFSSLINTVYKFCGIAGIIAAGAVIFKTVKRMTKNDERRF